MDRGILIEDLLGREDGPTDPDLWVSGAACELCIVRPRIPGDDLCEVCIDEVLTSAPTCIMI